MKSNQPSRRAFRSANIFAVALAFGAATATPAAAQEAAAPQSLTYADLASLAEDAPLVIRARITDQARVKAERAPGLAPGFARLYLEAETTSLIAGNAPIGGALKYLVDVPLTEKGKAPKLKKQDVILFARTVPGRPGEIQLVEKGAQLPWSETLSSRLRPILAELASADTPPVVTGVRDALSVRGNLVGESETQFFLETENDMPVSMTVLRRPNQPVRWGVSWTELVDQSAGTVEPETIAWYRLACSLPETLPQDANLARDGEARTRTAQDYAYVMRELGECRRTRTSS